MPDKKEIKKKKNEWRDPRQLVFLKYYMDTKSKTFGNAKASAIKAGYSENYADQIVSLTGDRKQKWLQGNDRYEKMIEKAEKNIIEFLEKEEYVEIWDKKGNSHYGIDGNILRTKADITKFVAERLGKFIKRDEVKVDVKGESLDKITETLTKLMNKKDYGSSGEDN